MNFLPPSKRSRNAGFTLIEVTVATSLFTMIAGVLFYMVNSIQSAVQVENVLVTVGDEGRLSMQHVVRQLRQAASGSIVKSDFPKERITYRIVKDLDGNGTSVDALGNVEYSGLRTIGADIDDVNGDGFTTTQMVLIEEDEKTPRVVEISNLLAAIAGIEFDLVSDNSIHVTLNLEKPIRPTEPENLIVQRFEETVTPRN